jgi:hypothetical protein
MAGFWKLGNILPERYCIIEVYYSFQKEGDDE